MSAKPSGGEALAVMGLAAVVGVAAALPAWGGDRSVMAGSE
jgi:hypothetical protein